MDTVTRNQQELIQELIPSCLQGNSITNSGVQTGNGADTGAVQTVKLDPAVLEARVTVHTSEMANRSQSSLGVHEEPPKQPLSFESMIQMQQAALLSLTPAQYQLLMKYVDTLRKQRVANQNNLQCAFCKNNGEPQSWYTAHALKNWRGLIQCPVLRAYRCPRCGATGDRAHTIKYCPGHNNTYFRSSSP